MAGNQGLIDALLARGGRDPRALLRAAEALRREQQEAPAVEAATAALLQAGDDRELVLRCRMFLTANVAKWHFPMLNDARRAALYRQAIERAVTPGMRVLEIGTGSGILAMMAVRAGAAHVFTCEAEPTIAHMAREIIAANGFSDRITVIGRHSTKLDAQADLGGRADLLVSEIIASDLLAEGVLPAHEHAIAELLVPGAPVLPCAGTIHVALAMLDNDFPRSIHTLEGFDLSAFNRLRSPVRNIYGDSPDLRLLSGSAEAMAFDFTTAAYRDSDRTSVTLVSHGGRIEGILQWMRLMVDDQAVYDTEPGPDVPRSWASRYHALPEPRDTEPGEPITVHVAHDRDKVIVWAE